MNKHKTKSAVREEKVIPLVQEEVRIGKRTRVAGITRITKTVHEKVEQIDQPLQEDEVQIEHVMVNRFIDTPVGIRHEAGVTIVPLLEEVLVIEKKLLLKEELHITKRIKTLHKPQRVVLRKEEAKIEHFDVKDEMRSERREGE